MKRVKTAALVTSLVAFLATPALGQGHHQHHMPKEAVDDSQVNVPALKETVKSYVDVAAALADDKFDDAKSAAKVVHAKANKALAAAQDADLKKTLTLIQKKASKVAASADIETARKEFQALSENVIAMVQSNRELKGAFEIFRCPMVKGFNKWMQAGEKTQNPYYGTKMQSCGLKAQTI